MVTSLPWTQLTETGLWYNQLVCRRKNVNDWFATWTYWIEVYVEKFPINQNEKKYSGRLWNWAPTFKRQNETDVLLHFHSVKVERKTGRAWQNATVCGTYSTTKKPETASEVGAIVEKRAQKREMGLRMRRGLGDIFSCQASGADDTAGCK